MDGVDNVRTQSAMAHGDVGALNELLLLAVRVGGIGIFETDLERRLVRFSPELCSILGLPVSTQMAYEEAALLIDERDRTLLLASIEAAHNSADRGKWSGQYRVLRADGAIRWVSIHGRGLHPDVAGGQRAVRSIGTVIDITHLKETEAALKENERRLRFALEAAKMGTFEADITSSEARIDGQEARLLGLPEATRVVSAQELRNRIPLADFNAIDAKKERLTHPREAYHHEFRVRMRDGTERWLSAYADVRANRIFGVSLDVTPRKLAEAALRDSDARLRVAASAAGLGVFEWNSTTNRADWENEGMYEIFGRTRADGPLSKQQLVAGHLHSDDAHEFNAALKEAMRTQRSLHTICRIRRKSGEWRWLQIDGKFEAAGTGGPTRLIGVVADITTRKRLEARAERLAERLVTIQAEERRTIAQELHDSTAQHLVAASLSLMRLRPANPLENEEQPWNDLERSLGEAIRELRNFAYLLHPPTLRSQRLRLSLQQYVGDFANRSGLVIKLRSDGKVDKLPTRVQRTIFRIVQEALANIYRHASAAVALIELRWIGPRLHVIVTDDGRGLQRRPAHRAGAGMRGIGMRLKLMGGRLKISRITPSGTRIHASVPVGADCRKIRAAASGDEQGR